MEPLKYNPNAGGGSGALSTRPSPYDPRAADAMMKIVKEYRENNFQTQINEAAEIFGFDPVVVSKITTWEEFIKILGESCQTMQTNILAIELKHNTPLNMENLYFLLMCKYVIENYSPNGPNANARLNAFMQGSTADYTSYGGDEESLRLFQSNIPVGIIKSMHAYAHELEKEIRNTELLTGIFAVQSVKDDFINILEQNPLFTLIFAMSRSPSNQTSNPVEVIPSARMNPDDPYVKWFIMATPTGKSALIKEMTGLVDYMLSGLSPEYKQSLSEFVLMVNATDQTLAELNAKIKDMCSTSYIGDKMTAEQHIITGTTNSIKIAGALLEMCLFYKDKKGNILKYREYSHIEYKDRMVSEARDELAFLKADLIYDIVYKIVYGDPDKFEKGWFMFHPIDRTIKGTSKIGLPANTRPTHQNVTDTQIAEFLKVREDHVRLGFDRASMISEEASRSFKAVSSISKTASSKYAIPLPASSSSSASTVQEPLVDERRAKRLNMTEEIRSILSSLRGSIDYSYSYLRSIRELFSPYFESVRGAGRDLYDRSVSVVASAGGASATFARGLYDQSAVVASNLFNGSGPNTDLTFVPRNINSNPNYSSPNITMNAGVSDAGVSTPASGVRNPRGKDISGKEKSLKSGKHSISKNTQQMSSTAPPARVVHTSQDDYDRVFGNIRTPISHVPSNVPAITYTPYYAQPIAAGGSRASNPNVFGQPVGGGSRAPLYIQNPVGGSMASSSINPNNVMGGTSPFTSQFRSTGRFDPDPYYGRESLATTPASSRASSRASSPTNRGNIINSMRRTNMGGKPRHSMSKNKKTLRRNPRKLMSRRQKYSRRK